MGPASLRAGPSIAAVRANQRFVESVSGKIAFRTVRALAKARAGTRRGIDGCNTWRPATGSFRVCLQYLGNRRHREAMLQRKSNLGPVVSRVVNVV
jgi:hypothetical protein